MNQDSPEIGQDNQCCKDSNCCSTCGTPPKKDNRTLILRILVSVGVLLIAAGLTAYVLTSRNPGPASIPAADDMQPTPAAGRSVIIDLNWVKKVYQSSSGDSFTFALLPGEDMIKNTIASEQIETLVRQLGNQNKKITLFMLDRADPEYSTTLNRLLIRETPAVIGLNSSGNIVIINGSFTSEKLYEAYYISSSACCPPTGGKCCGSN